MVPEIRNFQLILKMQRRISFVEGFLSNFKHKEKIIRNQCLNSQRSIREKRKEYLAQWVRMKESGHW